jgi:Lon protease-like protein
MTGGIEKRRHRRSAPVAVLVALVGFAGAARAADDSPYTVAKIPVDITDKSAVAAKNKALAEAEQRALDKVLSRVVPFSAQAQLPPLPLQTAEALVNGLSMMSPYGPPEKQALLEAPDLKTRAELLIAITEIEIAKKYIEGEPQLQ